MRSKFSSCLVYYKHAVLCLVFSVSVCTYFIYTTGSWATVPVPLSLLTSFGEGNNEIESSKVEYETVTSTGAANDEFETVTISVTKSTEPARVLQSPSERNENEDHTMATLFQENTRMACTIPKLNPFDASIKEHIEDPAPAKCDTDRLLLFKTDLNSTLIQVKDPQDYGFFSCCYREMKRLDRDSRVIESKRCIKVDNVTVIPSQSESIIIYCKKMVNGSKKVTVPMDMFNFIHLKPQVEKRVQEWQDGKELKDRRVNVVILGIDAVSHMNFKRVMPKTLKYITEQLNAIGMDGYTKVGDNTFPNIVPVTTGMSVEELKQACWKANNNPVDSCPFIWNNYSSNGYRTAYGEDAVWMGIFNYQKRGFFKPPTDYYNNAFTYRMEELIGHYHLINCKMCYGPRLGFQVSLDYLRAMAIRMGGQRRYFQFIWATSLFHDYLNQGKLGDEALLETMEWFNEENKLENTVFILMSDHGIRWGGIRSTIQGKIEERMPFLYFLFPEWFKEQYRSAVSNLIRNKARLTTPFDLHETLLDLLHLDNITEKSMNKRYKYLKAPELPRGISLFLPVPARRTCKDAGIDEHWCVCQTSVTIKDPNVPIVRKAAVKVVHVINKMFVNFPQCVSLKLNAVLNAQVLQADNKEMNDSSSQVTSLDDERLKSHQFTCSVSISVLPSNATFEATITRHTNGEWKVSGDISRTNLYGSQSRCVTDYNIKKFCYCL